MKLKSLKLNRIKKLILPLGFLLFFASCEPGVDYSHVIQNNSDFEVKVLTKIGMWYLEGKDTIFTPIDTITIGKNTSKVIYTNGGIGSVYDFKNCDFPFDSIPMLVYFVDSIGVIPNINNIPHWDFRIIKEHRNKGGVCECRMTLTNEIFAE